MKDSSCELLVRGLDELKLNYDEQTAGLLSGFINELETWNKHTNMVKAQGDSLITRHILDSLAPISFLRKIGGAHWADLGSGAGLPGMLLAIFEPEREITLVERSSNKCAFLKGCAQILGLGDRVCVQQADLKKAKACFDMVTFRALGTLSQILTQANNIICKDTVIAAYKGKAESLKIEIDCLKQSHPHIDEIEVIPYKVPFLNEERHLVVCEARH